MKKYLSILILFIVLTLAACSEYSKILKSDDYEAKYQAALKYYEEKEYYKAYALMDELMGIYNGTNKAEKLYYYLAYCDYYLQDYTLAATRFNIFYKRYPSSQWAEDALFMSAKSNYHNSPNYSLDQQETYKAIEELQIFANTYPYSVRKDTCNILIEQLRSKLEKKAYEGAYLYFHTENYKAAIIAFTDLLDKFPDSENKEKVNYYVLKSRFLLAENSVLSKKKERYEEFTNSYVKFVDSYSGSIFLKELETDYEKAKKFLENKNYGS